MARVHPTLPRTPIRSAGEAAERHLLQRLAEGLSGAYDVFHGVHWSAGSGPNEHHGEIDIVVANQAGDLLLIELKSGEVEFRKEGIFKLYRGEAKSVIAQTRHQYDAMRNRLSTAHLTARLHHLLVLPDVKVHSETVQWPVGRVVDSEGYEQIIPRITELVGPGTPNPSLHERVVAFLEDRFQVAPDVSALSGRLQHVTRQLAAGLATWVPRIESPSNQIRVLGTAGSGKTQLALRLLRDAAARGQRASYVCFNRTLADHIARVAPASTPAETFHEFAVRMCRKAGRTVDFSEPGMFDRAAAGCIEWLRDADPDLDLLVLDEGQDLQPEWVMALASRLRTDGRLVLMEDPNQALYRDREPFDLPDAVTVTSNENFRTPRALVGLINALGLCPEIQGMSAHQGEIPDPVVCADDAGFARATEQAVQHCLDRGFALDDIAVVSLKGRERSALQQADKLGPWQLRRFTGQYDAGGGAIWTEGELPVESVRRFKGQAAPAVVLTECDFEQADEIARRLLFVGITRASMHLEWVMTARTENCLGMRLKA